MICRGRKIQGRLTGPRWRRIIRVGLLHIFAALRQKWVGFFSMVLCHARYEPLQDRHTSETAPCQAAGNPPTQGAWRDRLGDCGLCIQRTPPPIFEGVLQPKGLSLWHYREARRRGEEDKGCPTIWWVGFYFVIKPWLIRRLMAASKGLIF